MSQSTSQSMARLEAALENLGSEHEPAPGWEARVLAQIEAQRPRRPWWLAIPAVALVALVILVAWPPERHGSLDLALKTISPGPVMRGKSTHAGEVIAATASGGQPYRAIWVYRDDELIAVCPGASWCEISGATLRAHIALASYGSYVFVAVSSAQPFPPARGTYDDDLAAAVSAGATYVTQPRDAR